MDLKFSLNDPNRDRSAVSARFTYNKTRPKFSTGVTVPTALWLADNSGVKISPQITAKHGMNPMTAQNINDTLAKIKRQFALAWGEELKQDEFDVKRVIARAKTGEVKKPNSKKTVEQIVTEYMEYAQANPVGRNGQPMKPSTVKQYRTAIRRAAALGERMGGPILASDLCQDHWSEYYQLEVNELKKKPSHASSVWVRMQAALRWAHERGEVVHDDIVFNRIKRIHPKGYRRAIVSLEELDELRAMDLSGAMERTRDLFIIGNWTALRVSDLMQLDKVKVLKRGGRQIIQVDTQKTGDLIDIPLHPHVIAIRERWNGWPRRMAAQHYNSNLKELGKLAGWNQKEYGEKVSLVKIDGKMERRTKSGTYPKYELLTSHLSRRSFATNMYSLGIMSSSDIRKMTGHKTERLLEVYIHSNPKDVTNRIDDVFKTLS